MFQDDRVHRCAERGTIDKEEWAEFLHTKDKVFTDWDEVRKEIEAESLADTKEGCSHRWQAENPAASKHGGCRTWRADGPVTSKVKEK